MRQEQSKATRTTSSLCAAAPPAETQPVVTFPALDCAVRNMQVPVMNKPKLTPEQASDRRKRLAFQAARLRRLREALGLQQNDAARQVSLDPPRWNKYERGIQAIDILVLQQFCEVNHTSAEYVVTANMASLQEPVRGRVLAMEQEAMTLARAGKLPPELIPADIRERLDTIAKTHPGSSASSPSPSSKRQKSSKVGPAVRS